jgi:hypothetical protein
MSGDSCSSVCRIFISVILFNISAHPLLSLTAYGIHPVGTSPCHVDVFFHGSKIDKNFMRFDPEDKGDEYDSG